MDALVICIGNKARGDDGVGRAVADLLEERLPDQVALIERPQLDVVMASDVADAAFVIFVDAERRSEPPVRVDKVVAIAARTDGHALGPGALLALAEALYGARPDAVLVSIAAPSMDHVDGLSETARAASEEAARTVVDLLSQRGVRR